MYKNSLKEVHFPYVPLAPEIVERKRKLTRLRKRRIVVYRANGNVTETAAAFLYNAACRFAISDLKQLYTKEATPYILNLFFSTCNAAKLTATDNYMKNHIDNATAVVKMQKTVEHKRKFKKIGKIRYSVAIIPYTTLELTGYGKAMCKATEDNNIPDSDGLDVIHEAYLKLLELAQDGILTSFDSVEYCSNYVYAHLNQYIRKNRKSNASCEDFTVFMETPANTKYLKSEAAQKALAKIETESIIDSIMKYLESKLPKNSNRENILFTFEQLAVYGKTRREIAELLNVSERTTGKYMQLIERVANNAEVNEILHKLIYG